MGEYGRATRFQWSDSDLCVNGDMCQIRICEFTNRQKPYFITYGELKKVINELENSWTDYEIQKLKVEFKNKKILLESEKNVKI